MFVDLLPGQGQSQCAQAPSLSRASGEDLRHELDSDFQTVGFESKSGNESSLALWLAYVAETRLVGLLDHDRI